MPGRQHRQGAAAADAFLAQWVPKILASPAYKKDGLLIITFGEANGGSAAPRPPTTDAAEPATPARQVGALLLSPLRLPGRHRPGPLQPLSLLRSTEDLFGLSHLGGADGAKVQVLRAGAAGGNGGGD